MTDREEDEIKKQMEEVKLLDSDLFEEDFDEDVKQKIDNPVKVPKRKKTTVRKFTIAFVSFVLLLTIIGPLAETFNIASIQFLKKSYQLSQRADIQEYKKAVVTIKAEDRKGTGFNISSNGLIVTNYHIVKDKNEAIIAFPEGPTQSAEVITKLPKMDIAILKLDNQSGLPYLIIDRDNNFKEEKIYFIGNPLMFNQIANEGRIIGKSTSSELDTSVIVIDAPVYKGNSGSPIINKEGKVIGVIYAKGTIHHKGKKKQVGFAIPIDVLPIDLFNHVQNLSESTK
jgi:serine protease Do